MCPPQERNCIQHHWYGGQGFLVTEERVTVTEDSCIVTEDKGYCHGGQLYFYRGQGLFFLFIALCRMQNPIGGMM